MDFALLSLLFGLDAAPNATQLAQRANKLYRAKRYLEACTLFQQVTELTPLKGPAWGDLGLCVSQLPEQRALALATSYQAILLSNTDEKARKAVYYNLGRFLAATYPSHVPGPTEEGPLAELEGELPQCELFDAVAGCDRGVWVCSSWRSADLTLARFARDPRTIAPKPWPDGNTEYGDISVMLGRDVLVLEDGQTETYRSGTSVCRFGVSCRVVWPDACTGRVGYYCETRTGVPVTEAPPAEENPCTVTSRHAGELRLP